MSALFRSLYKTVAVPGTAEALGASTIQFNTGHFVGRKSDTESNTGRVFIRFSAGAAGSVIIHPGVTEPIRSATDGAILNAAQFYVDAETAGDGVLFFYALADWKSFCAIESKIEDAVLKYLLTIGATLDDCSFTAGITDGERTADNVNVYCQGCNERIINTGNWDCQVVVQVRTAVGKSGSDNRLDRHRLRTAYVRDIITDPDAEEIIGALSNSITVYEQSIREIRCEQRIEGRQWVSDINFTITASGSVLI